MFYGLFLGSLVLDNSLDRNVLCGISGEGKKELFGFVLLLSQFEVVSVG